MHTANKVLVEAVHGFHGQTVLWHFAKGVGLIVAVVELVHEPLLTVWKLRGYLKNDFTLCPSLFQASPSIFSSPDRSGRLGL